MFRIARVATPTRHRYSAVHCIAVALFLVLGVLVAGAARAVPTAYTVQAPPDGHGELDSVALWIGPDSSTARLFISDKTRDIVEIHDPVANVYLGSLGGSGSDPGRLQRPNGIAVAYGVFTVAGPRDMLLVVERDNNRVSAYMLPDLFYLGEFGSDQLNKPYGIAVHREGFSTQVWITSTGTSPDRVHIYDLGWGAFGFTATLTHWFATPGGSKLESVVIDSVWQRALLCDEANGDIMVYDLQGNLLSRFGAGLFADEPEGIALYDVDNNDGYIVVADQQSTPMDFEVFNRRTFASIGRFNGPTFNTDGITLTQAALPNLPNGSLFAVHNDATVHAYDWTAIATELGLCTNSCTTSAADGRFGHQVLTNQPNPFNPSTTIRYSVDTAAYVQLTIFDTHGKAVARLVDGVQPPGSHEIVWHGRSASGRPASSGIYWVRLIAGSRTWSHKVTLLQ